MANKLSIARNESIAAIRDAFDISAITVKRWLKRGCPHSRRGRRYFFNAGEVAAWLRDNPNLGWHSGRPKTPRSAAWEAADLRRLEAKATLCEVENARRLSQMIAVDDAQAIFNEIVEHAKKLFRALPAEIAPVLEGKEPAAMQAILESKIWETLNTLAKQADAPEGKGNGPR